MVFSLGEWPIWGKVAAVVIMDNLHAAIAHQNNAFLVQRFIPLEVKSLTVVADQPHTGRVVTTEENNQKKKVLRF